MRKEEIKQILLDLAQYLNDNYGSDGEPRPKDVTVYPHADKVVFICWECGAIVYIDGGIYYIGEDDGYWFVEDDILQDGDYSREVFGYETSGTSIYYAIEIGQAFIKLGKYVEDNGRPEYLVGFEPPLISHYIL